MWHNSCLRGAATMLCTPFNILYDGQVWDQLNNLFPSLGPNFVIQGDFNQLDTIRQKLGEHSNIQGVREFINRRTNGDLVELRFHWPNLCGAITEKDKSEFTNNLIVY